MARLFLVTGAAGFIGYHVAQRLLDRGDTVVGLDNVNDYYDVQLKEARLAELDGHDGFSFVRLDLADRAGMQRLFAEHAFTEVIHLGAQAGVRYSLDNPGAYIDSNLVGFGNVLEGCRHHGIRHLVYASSSSVYGANRTTPFEEGHRVDHPVSLYAATKKANELMAHTYAHLYGLPVTGLRFFTVYGPWGRPDMAYFLFTKAILEGKPIDVFNHGQMRRDFTYVDDVVEGVVRVADQPATPAADWDPFDPDLAVSAAPYRVFNIGNRSPVELGTFIETLERVLGREAAKTYHPMQPGDVLETSADTRLLEAAVGFRPSTPLEEGLTRFARWYSDYYGVALPADRGAAA